MEIKNLDDLISSSLIKDGKKIVSYSSRNLLPVGENYGSTMLALAIKIKDWKTDEEEIIQCVAKMVPPSEAVWKFFNIPLTFKKEVMHYTVILPTLTEFGKENGIDNLMHPFAKCFGARISLDEKSDVVDRDAVLVLENVEVQGYSVGDRVIGFDLETAKVILKDMAVLHGATIALKLNKPEEFKAKIFPDLERGIVYSPSDETLDNFVKFIVKYASRNPKCVPLLPKIENGVRKMKNLFLYSKIREPFATIVHTDIWTNNVMVKYEAGEAVHSIFVDYAIYRYGSPARDMLFFIYSSVKLDVLEENVDALIKFYYVELIKVLEKLKCDINIFSYELFMNEVDEAARDVEFCHAIFMLTPIFTMKGHAKDLTEWTPDHIVPANEETLHGNYHKRLFFTVLDYAKRNWI